MEVVEPDKSCGGGKWNEQVGVEGRLFLLNIKMGYVVPPVKVVARFSLIS